MHKMTTIHPRSGPRPSRQRRKDFTVRCSCGWQEAAQTESSARERFSLHQQYPHIYK